MDFEFVLKQLLEGFDRSKVRYAALGGFGMGAWGAERATKDLDFLVHSDDLERAHELMTALKYKRIFASDDVSQYRGEMVPVWGWVDFIHASRPLAREVLSLAASMRVFSGRLELKVLLPEDIIGFKVQAMANGPERGGRDAPDIEMLIELRGDKLDWDRVEKYYVLFGMQEQFRQLKERFSRG